MWDILSHSFHILSHSPFQAGPWTPEATVEHPEAVGRLSLSLIGFLASLPLLKSTSKFVEKCNKKGASTAQGIPQGWIRRYAGDDGLLPK